jgi:hypothetical protein
MRSQVLASHCDYNISKSRYIRGCQDGDHWGYCCVGFTQLHGATLQSQSMWNMWWTKPHSEGLRSTPVLSCQYLILILSLHCRDSPQRVMASSKVRLQISVFTISSNKEFPLICLSILIAVFPVVCYVSIIPPFLHAHIPIVCHRRTYIVLAIQSVCT